MNEKELRYQIAFCTARGRRDYCDDGRADETFGNYRMLGVSCLFARV